LHFNFQIDWVIYRSNFQIWRFFLNYTGQRRRPHTHAHWPLWTHVCKLYPYEHLRRTEPADLEVTTDTSLSTVTSSTTESIAPLNRLVCINFFQMEFICNFQTKLNSMLLHASVRVGMMDLERWTFSSANWRDGQRRSCRVWTFGSAGSHRSPPSVFPFYSATATAAPLKESYVWNGGQNNKLRTVTMRIVQYLVPVPVGCQEEVSHVYRMRMFCIVRAT
jgi:hypothetical protein